MKRLLIFLFIIIAQVAFSQSDGSADSKIKKAEKKTEQRQRNKKKAELKGKKRHESIQDKATRKRMKRHRKGPIHVDAYDRRPFFIKRWLKRKEH
jgi:Ni/Co efflux regulator RcnB